MPKVSPLPQRTRGAKPKDPGERSARVATAVQSLVRVGAAFTVAEVAEKAGISKATLYRSPELRSIIGAKGDIPRPIDPGIHAKLAAQHTALKAKARDLRHRLAEAELNWEEMRRRALDAERRCQAAERFAASAGAAAHQTAQANLRRGASSITAVAAELSPEAIRQARRRLARALHPDLFAKDTAAAALATELLKTLNALAE